MIWVIFLNIATKLSSASSSNFVSWCLPDDVMFDYKPVYVLDINHMNTGRKKKPMKQMTETCSFTAMIHILYVQMFVKNTCAALCSEYLLSAHSAAITTTTRFCRSWTSAWRNLTSGLHTEELHLWDDAGFSSFYNQAEASAPSGHKQRGASILRPSKS